MDKPAYDVALALVRRDDQWLVALRHDAAHLGGVWEFPGGKCEPGESAEQGALRELVEECGVRATVERVLAPVCCEYDDRVVRLMPVVCLWQSGAPRPLGSQECRWVSAAELTALDMPAANVEIIRAALEVR